MAGRIRTTKKLAQRITLDYFKTLHGIPRWRRILSGVLVVAGLLWLTWYAVAGSPKPYNAGPLSRSHALLGQNCAACHVAQAGYQKSATDQACLACHDGPTHHAEQTFTPACSNCHVEHQGIMRLASTSDRACTQCHDHLTTKEGKVKYVANITGFASGDHPDFAVWRNGGMDPGTIKLNHKVHLKADLRGPNGTVQLKCADCHEAPAAATIIAAPVTSLSPVPDPPSPDTTDTSRPAPPVLLGSKAGAVTLADKSYMAPINFDKHCASCHPLQFDRRISEPAPHDKQPKEVYDFMVAKLTAYIAAHPAEIPLVDEPDKRLPSTPAARAQRGRMGATAHGRRAVVNVAQSVPGVPHHELSERWRCPARGGALQRDHALAASFGIRSHRAPDGEVRIVPRQSGRQSRDGGPADPAHRELREMPQNRTGFRGSAVL